MRHKQILKPNRILSKPDHTGLPRVPQPTDNHEHISAPKGFSAPRVPHTSTPLQTPNVITPPSTQEEVNHILLHTPKTYATAANYLNPFFAFTSATTFFNFHTVNAVINPKNGKEAKITQLITGQIDGQDKNIWLNALTNEIGRLAQGIKGRIDGTNTIFFIHPEDIPNGKVAAFPRLVCDIRPQKEDQHRVRLTIAGQHIEYAEDVGTPTADMTTSKILFNSVLSTKKC